jgi:hypothetical protein
MADPPAIHDRLAALTTALDALTDSLAPLLTTPPATLARDLPARDAARLHILAAYAPESLLFNAVRLAAAGATGGGGGAPPEDPDEVRRHPVVEELGRVRQYAARLRDAEAVQRGPAMRVDREAVARFVKAGVASAPAEEDVPGEAQTGAGAVKRGSEGGEDESPRGKRLRKGDRRTGGMFGDAADQS